MTTAIIYHSCMRYCVIRREFVAIVEARMELTFRFKSQTDHRCSIISDHLVTSTLWITSQYQNLVWVLEKSMFCVCAILASMACLAVHCFST